MTRGHRRYFSIAFIILAYLLALVASNDDHDDHDHEVCTGTNDATSETCQNDKPKPLRAPDSGGIVMAQSSLPNAGWGVFSMVDCQKGTEDTRGNIVIQITDPNGRSDHPTGRRDLSRLWPRLGDRLVVTCQTLETCRRALHSFIWHGRREPNDSNREGTKRISVS
jgi:hypothetical protein